MWRGRKAAFSNGFKCIRTETDLRNWKTTVSCFCFFSTPSHSPNSKKHFYKHTRPCMSFTTKTVLLTIHQSAPHTVSLRIKHIRAPYCMHTTTMLTNTASYVKEREILQLHLWIFKVRVH